MYTFSRMSKVSHATPHTAETLPPPVLAGRDFLSNLDMTAGELRVVLDTGGRSVWLESVAVLPQG